MFPSHTRHRMTTFSSQEPDLHSITVIEFCIWNLRRTTPWL